MKLFMTQKININEKFSKFSEHWRPKIVAELNGQEFKLAKIKGEYPFHAHEVSYPKASFIAPAQKRNATSS